METPVDTAKAALKAVARRLDLEVRDTTSGVLQIKFSQTVSFSTLNLLHDAAKQASTRTGVAIQDVLATHGQELLLALRFSRKRERTGDAPTEKEMEAVVKKVDDTIAAYTKSSKDAKLDEIEVAREILEKLLGRLAGTDNEKVVQSFGIFGKKLASSDPRPRVVVAIRINANTPIKLGELKTALGPCWVDGALTSRESLEDVSSVSLPLTAEGEASRSFGNLPLLLVTSVPVSDK